MSAFHRRFGQILKQRSGPGRHDGSPVLGCELKRAGSPRLKRVTFDLISNEDEISGDQSEQSVQTDLEIGDAVAVDIACNHGDVMRCARGLNFA